MRVLCIAVWIIFFISGMEGIGQNYASKQNVDTLKVAEDSMLKDTTKLLSSQNLKVSFYSTWGDYNLLIRDKHTRPSNFWLDQLPYKLADKKFQFACKKAVVQAMKSVFPEVCKLIERQKLQSVAFILNFDDRKEYIDKYFMVHVKSPEILILDVVEKEITQGNRLAIMVKEAMEQVYDEIPVLPRETLPADVRVRVEDGARGYAYFTDIFVEIERKDLWRYKKKKVKK